MEKTNLLTLVVTLTVGIILAGSLLMPVLTDATTTEKTLKNTGYYSMDKITDDGELVLFWDYTKPTIITVNDVDIDLSTKGLVGGMSYTILGSDNFIVRYVYGATPYIQAFASQEVTPAFIQATIATTSTFTATLSEGTYTFETTNASYPTPIELTASDESYCINPSGTGAYVMKKSTEGAFVETNTTIIVLNGDTATIAGTDMGLFAKGTIGGNLNATIFRGTSVYDITLSDFTYNTTDVAGYIDLVKLTSVQFTVTQNAQDINVTYSYFIVPVNVTAELSQHLDAGEIALITALPLLVIIGLVMAGVGAISIRNRD